MRSTSPFYPGQAAPDDTILGRDDELTRVERRGVLQVLEGRQQAFYFAGGRGFGKSSLASFAARKNAARHNLVLVPVSCRNVRSEETFAAKVLAGATRESPERNEIYKWLSRFVSGVSSVGVPGVVKLDMAAICEAGNQMKEPDDVGDFLLDLVARDRARGVVLVLDEIETACRTAWFGSYLKALWESRACLDDHLPLLLLAAGTQADYAHLGVSHPSSLRMWDLVPLGPLDPASCSQVLMDGFELAEIEPNQSQVDRLARASFGHPLLLQILGDLAFWRSAGELGEREVSEALTLVRQQLRARLVTGDLDSLSESAVRTLRDVFSRRPIGEPCARRDVAPVLAALLPAPYETFPYEGSLLVDPLFEAWVLHG